MVGYIGEDWQSFGFPGIDEHNSTPFKTKSGIKIRNTSITWTEELDRLNNGLQMVMMVELYQKMMRKFMMVVKLQRIVIR